MLVLIVVQLQVRDISMKSSLLTMSVLEGNFYVPDAYFELFWLVPNYIVFYHSFYAILTFSD